MSDVYVSRLGLQREVLHLRQRAQRAEAECQKMRSIIAGDHTLYGDPDAPHTPEQTSYCPRCTQEMDRYSVTHCPSCDVSVGGPPSEQAHGDALYLVPERETTGMLQHYTVRADPPKDGTPYETVYRHPAASGVPEEVRRLLKGLI